MKVYLAGDHHAIDTIQIVEEYLNLHNIEFENLGSKNKTQQTKLEAFIPKVTNKVLENKQNLGILSCGTGIGVEIGANKFTGIRACLATNKKIAEWSKIYDNCNVLCLVGWEPNKKQIHSILNTWFQAKYDGNQDRLKMFKTFDEWR